MFIAAVCMAATHMETAQAEQQKPFPPLPLRQEINRTPIGTAGSRSGTDEGSGRHGNWYMWIHVTI